MQGLSESDSQLCWWYNARYSRRMQPASQRRRGLEVNVIAKVPQMDGGSPPQSPSLGRLVSAAVMLSVSQCIHYVPAPGVLCFSCRTTVQTQWLRPLSQIFGST
jgi:hypothetical protein